MPVTGRANVTALPAAGSGKYSVSRGAKLAVQLAGLAALTPASLYIGTTDPGPPTTFADVLSRIGGDLTGPWDTLTVSYESETGLYTVAVVLTMESLDYALEDVLWVAFFGSDADSPDPTTPVDLAIGPFSVIP